MTQGPPTTKWPNLLDVLAQILRDNDVKVVQVTDKDRFLRLPHITFHGDDDEGMRVAQIALAHGYPVFNIEHHWNYYDGDEDESETGWSDIWVINFKRSAPGAAPGEDIPDQRRTCNHST